MEPKTASECTLSPCNGASWDVSRMEYHKPQTRQISVWENGAYLIANYQQHQMNIGNDNTSLIITCVPGAMTKKQIIIVHYLHLLQLNKFK